MVKKQKIVSSQPFVDAVARKYRNERIARAAQGRNSIKSSAPVASPAYDYTAPMEDTGDAVDSGDQSFLEKLGDPTSGPGKFIDVISQPLYAISQHAAETKDAIEEKGIAEGFFGIGADWDVRNPLSAKASNLGTGNSKNTVSDLLRDEEYVMDDGRKVKSGNDALLANEEDSGLQKFGKAAGGLALDIAGDPLSYIPGAAIAAVGKGVGKGLAAPVKLGQRAAEGTATRTAADALAQTGTRAGEAVGRGLNRAADAGARFSQTTVGKPVAAVGRGIGTVLSPLQSVARGIDSHMATKAARALPEEVGEFTETAARLSPTGSSVVEDFLRTSARPADEELELAVAATAAKTGTSLDDVTQGLSEAVRDANKIDAGSFVPEVSSKVKVRAGDVQGPKNQTLRKRDAKRPRDVSYSESLASILRKTDNADDPAMYPALADADIKAPFFKPKRSTPAEVADEAIAPIPAAVDEVVEAVPAPQPKQLSARILMSEHAMKNPKATLPLPGGKLQKPIADHLAIAFAPEAELIATLRKLEIGGHSLHLGGIKAAKELQQKIQQGLQPLYRSLAPAPEATRTASNGVQEGLAAAEAPTAPSVTKELADKVRETQKKVSAKKETAKPDLRKYNGVILKQYRDKLISTYGIHPEHVEELLSAPTVQAFGKRLAAMKAWKTDGPMYEVYEHVLKASKPPKGASAADQIKAGVAGEKTADDIAADAAAPISEEALDALRFAASDSVVTQNWTGMDPELKFRTLIQNTMRTSDKVGEGYGVNRNAANAKFQANAGAVLINKASSEATSRGLKGAARSKWMRDYTVTGLEEIENKLRALGVQPILGNGTSGIPLGITDVIKALETTNTGARFLEGRVFDAFGKQIDWSGKTARKVGSDGLSRSISYPGSVKLDAILNAAEPLLKAVMAEVEGITDQAKLLEEITAIAKKGVTPEVLGKTKLVIKESPVTTLSKGADGKVLKGPDGKAVVESVPAANVDAIATSFANALLDPRVIENLLQRVNDNTAAAGIAFGQHVNELTAEAIGNVVAVINDPNTTTRALADTLSTEGGKAAVKAASDNAVVPPNSLVEVTTAEKFDEVLSEIVSVRDRETANYLVTISRAVEQGKSREAIDAMYQSYRASVSEGFHSIAVQRLMQSGDSTAAAMNAGVFKFLQPFLSKLVNHFDNATLHPALLTQGNVGREFQSATRKGLREINEKFRGPEGKAQLVDGMQLLQRGIALDGAGPAADAARELQNATEILFDITPDGSAVRGTHSALGGLLSKGFDIDHVMSKMQHGKVKLPAEFQFNRQAAEQAASASGNSVAYELSQQWKSWKIDDPIEFLAQMTTVLGSLATDSAVAFEGLRIAQSLGMASNTRRAGFVRYVSTPESVLAKYLPENTFFDKDVVAEFKKMDEILSDSVKMSDFLDNVISPITQKWKAGMTIYHLGHHIRNLVGDVSISFMQDGVKNPMYYSRALRQMSPGVNIRKNYTGWDALAALHGESVAKQGGHFAAKVKIQGGAKTLDDVEVQRLAMEHGVLPDFAVQEDLVSSSKTGNFAAVAETIENPQGSMKRVLQPFNGKVRQAAGSISEARDDYVRMAHFMHCLEHPPGNKPFASLEDAARYASARVRKAHPDGADLTGFERRLRLLFPFYSWTRKAIPLVIESTLLHPSRVSMYPKAMYNWAQSQGMDLESMSDPFPQHELYPEFLRDRMTGPLYRNEDGDAIGMDFGFPAADIVNDFGNNPLKGFLGMVNPLYKAPIEIASGSRLQNQTPINSATEHVESNIPGVAQFAQLTGYSPTGSAVDILKGDGPRKQISAEKGNKAAFGEGSGPLGFDDEAFANRTLNFRKTNMDKESYRNIAEMEKRDKIKAERDRILKELGKER